jgi:hypothetical protein
MEARRRLGEYARRKALIFYKNDINSFSQTTDTMNKLLPILLLAINVAVLSASAATCASVPPARITADTSVVDRWDITVHQPGREVPSWLEITRSGLRTLVGRFVGGGGSARPISKIEYANGKISFSIPPQWEREDRDLSVEGSLQGDSLTGTLTNPDGKS